MTARAIASALWDFRVSANACDVRPLASASSVCRLVAVGNAEYEATWVAC